MAELPGGLELRTATDRDREQIAALLTARGEPADAVDFGLVVDDPDEGYESCAVVVDGDRVVSTATLLRETVSIEDVDLPAGQVELVATEPGYEGRGLVRALMEWAHLRSSSRGDVLQIMIGIPYFYRQFGYGYALPCPRTRPLTGPVEPVDPAMTVRPATVADIPAMARLEDDAQSRFQVRMGHSAACWRWLLARDGSTQWVAERDGQVVGVCRTTPPDEGVTVGELAGEPAAARTLLQRASTMTADGHPVTVAERTGTDGYDAVAGALGALSGADAHPEWYYGRIQRLAPLLERLGPVLARRLAASGLADRTHEVLLSSWGAHVRFMIGPDGTGPVVEGGPEQYPISKGGSGVPPDALPALVLGPFGAIGLEERLPDCWLGRQSELMAVLFPPVDGDLLTFYLPF